MDRPWLNHYDSQVRTEPKLAPHPLPGLLDRAAEKWPGRIAVSFHNRRIKYKKLKKLAETFAANLKENGLRKGDCVAVMLPNTPQSIIAYWGILKAGGVVVMTNPLYMETEISHQLKDCKARFMIILDMLWPKIDKLRDSLPVKKYYITSISDALGFPLKQLFRFKMRRQGMLPNIDWTQKNVFEWRTLLKASNNFSPVDIDSSDPALLQYTGGTTGVAKGCILTHANMICNLHQCKAMFHDIGRKPETFLGVMPYFHIYGLTICMNFATLIGAVQLPFPRYVPQDLLKAIQKTRPTVFPGAPAIYVSLLQQKNVDNFDLSSIEFCISGSAPMPKEHIERFTRKTGARIVEGYGLTEASPVTHVNPLFGQNKIGSIGLPLPGTDAKIVDMITGGEPLPPGKVGELAIRGPQVMQGYYNRSGDTADVLRDGWLYTGDVAYMDEEGYFFIVDRKKDLIISGGYNIYPREIDEVLITHPKIKEAVAVGIPHQGRGETVKAYVILEDGEEMSKNEVVAYCREKLAGYKVPRKIEFRDELPKTMVGKILRRALREEEAAKNSA